MKDDGLGDWRIAWATRLAKDLPAAYPGGPAHKAGTPVHGATSTRDPKNRPVGFVAPSATALALSIAMKTATEANECLAEVVFEDVITPIGNGKSVKYTRIEPLFDYFEYCMVTLIFSFQALETFCNQIIANELKGNFTLERRKENRTFTALELEREASTEEKLCSVLPELLGVPSPKGSKVWENFVELKRARDATVHMKSSDQYPNQYDPSVVEDKDTLFYQFLNNDSSDFVEYAVNMIKYFAETKGAPRWLSEPIEFIGKKK